MPGKAFHLFSESRSVYSSKHSYTSDLVPVGQTNKDLIHTGPPTEISLKLTALVSQWGMVPTTIISDAAMMAHCTHLVRQLHRWCRQYSVIQLSSLLYSSLGHCYFLITSIFRFSYSICVQVMPPVTQTNFVYPFHPIILRSFLNFVNHI